MSLGLCEDQLSVNYFTELVSFYLPGLRVTAFILYITTIITPELAFIYTLLKLDLHLKSFEDSTLCKK